MSQQVTALTPELLEKQIADLEADATRYRDTADELDQRADGLRDRLEQLRRGEMSGDELRQKIVALASVDGWVTTARIRKWYPQVPAHQVERCIGELEREGILVRTEDLEPTYGERGKPAIKYALAGSPVPLPPVPPRKRKRTGETPTR